MRLRVKTETSASGDEENGGQATGKDTNFIGKINNLVTVDLQNIANGRDFGMLFVYMPVTIAACLYFLYNLVGWRRVSLLAPPQHLTLTTRTKLTT